jgi:hypothetical protein
MSEDSTHLFNQAQIAFEKETVDLIVSDLHLFPYTDGKNDLVIGLLGESFADEIEKHDAKIKVADAILGMIETYSRDKGIRPIDQPDVERYLGTIERAISLVRAQYEEELAE